MSFEQVIQKYKGKMVRVYTRDDTAILGFLIDYGQDTFVTLTLNGPNQCVVSVIPTPKIRCVLAAGFLEEHGKLCRHLYGALN